MPTKFRNKTRLYTHHSYLIQTSKHLPEWPGKKRKRMQIGEVKLSVAENMILYLEIKKKTSPDFRAYKGI